MKLSDVISMVKTAPSYVKEHWNKPAEGEYLSLKEMAAYTVSQAGTYIYATAGGLMTLSASYFCGSIMGLANMDFYLINLVSTIIGYVLMFMNPIGMLIYENHGRLSQGMKKFAHISYIGEILLGIACYFIPIHSFVVIMAGLPQIVGNILLISKLENQSIETNQKVYLLDEQIRESLLGMEGAWLDKEIEFDVELDSMKYLGNEGLMRHVWDNLISNAIKFSPKGGLVRLSLTKQADGIIFIIEDEGPGIPDDAKKRIFDKFYQHDNSRKQEGHGLGLPLAKRILSLCGGEIAVED